MSAMDSYPSWLLQRNLRCVYVLRSVHVYGTPAAGTNSRDCVYLRLQPRSLALARADLAQAFRADLVQAFHHEFSSTLLRNYGDMFPKAKWYQVNPAGFRYANQGVGGAAGRTARDTDPQLVRQGFVNAYCQTTLENDFNTVAARLFLQDNKFKEAMSTSPKLAAKARMVIEFYRSIDPFYTGQFFGVEDLLENTHR